MHKEAVFKLAAHSNTTGVGAQLRAQHKVNQSLHQHMLMDLIYSILFWASPLHVHYEDVDSLEGNLYKLLLLQAEDCPDLKAWVYCKEYTNCVLWVMLCIGT